MYNKRKNDLLQNNDRARLTDDRLLKIIAITLFFLIFVLPLNVLKRQLYNKSLQHKKWAQANRQNSLQKAISDFKNDLEPEIFLRKLIQKIWPEEQLSKSIYAANEHKTANQRKSAYQQILKQTSARLRAALDSSFPLFLVVGDGNMENVSFFLSPDLTKAKIGAPFKASINQQKNLAEYIAWFALLGNNFRKIPASLAKKYEEFAENNHTNSELRQKPTHFFKGILTSFIKKLPSSDLVHSYFSDIFSMQNLYFYSKSINRQDHPQGFLIVGFLEDQLSFDHIKKALLAWPDSKNVKRFFPGTPHSKAISENAKVVIEDYQIKSTDSTQRIIKLGVAVTEDHSAWLFSLNRLCEWLIKLSFLLWLAFSVKVAFFNFNFPVNLRLKLVFILSPAILFPAIAGTIYFFGIANNSFSLKTNLARSQLETELNKIELSYMETIDRQVLNNLTFKFKFARELVTTPLHTINFTKYSEYFGRNFENAFIYNCHGQYITLLRGTRTDKFNRAKFTNAVQALSNLGVIRKNSKTKKHLRDTSYTIGLVEDLAGMFDLSKAAGREAQNIPRISNINPLSRSHFYLFADSETPDLKPIAVGFMGVATDQIFVHRVQSAPSYPLNYFYSLHGDYSTEICLGKRDTTRLTNDSWLNDNVRKSKKFKSIMQKAMNMKESGSEKDDTSDKSFYSWRFYQFSPLILTGITKVNFDTWSDAFFDFAPVILCIFLLATLLLISKLSVKLFLNPLQVLKDAVKRIHKTGDYALEVELNNNDEFDLLGQSFNSMTGGLLQKKHISRFVSQRLIKAIESNSGLSQTAQATEMTILASDIRNFTTISEMHEPELVVETLNNYFSKMEACIISEGGAIDKFIGDAIIAVFLPENLKNPALNACKSALKMRNAIKTINEQKNIAFKIENGVGISSGTAIAATLGKTCARKDFTIIGELPQKAEKLEALSKTGKFSKVIIDLPTRNLIQKYYASKRIDNDERVEAFELTPESKK